MARGRKTTSLPRERLLEFLGEMLVIRRFEEKVEERFRAGDLAGFLHACIGHQIVQLECLRAGIWGTDDTWGQILAYQG